MLGIMKQQTNDQQQAIARLKELKRGMSYEAVAQRVGFPFRSVVRWISEGRINPVYAKLVLERLKEAK